MLATTGDRILVESEQVGSAPRGGEILEVIEGASTHYRIRWDDGHVSVFTPLAGGAKVVRYLGKPHRKHSA